jgi:RimJ/RimL family protein N-acetyltransferase
MSEPSWLVRTAIQDDGELLARFRSATSDAKWDVEVEQYISSGRLLAWWSDPLATPLDRRLLLLIDRETGEVVGVAAHQLESFFDGEAELAGSHLYVAALARDWQGKAFPGGERASDVLMSAVMEDVTSRVPPRYARVYGIVHEDNVRSLQLCARFGLTEEMSRNDPEYRRIVTPDRR